MEKELREAIKKNDLNAIMLLKDKYIQDRMIEGLTPGQAEMEFAAYYARLSPKPRRKWTQ